MEVFNRMNVRSKVAVLLAEFLGTAVLATAAINISRSQIGIAYFVALGVGLTLAVLILALGKFSGAHFNPAVTIGQWTIRKIGTLKAISYLAVQMLGGLAAWQLANYFSGREIQSIAGNEFDWKVLVAEAIGTFVFTFAFAAAIYQNLEDGKKTALIGGGLTIGIFTASLASNAVLNPAIALANQSWAVAYVVGPIIGAVIGFNLYVLFFAPVTSLSPLGRKNVNSTVGEPVLKDKKTSTAKVVSKSTTKKPATKKAAASKTKTTTKKKTTSKKK